MRWCGRIQFPNKPWPSRWLAAVVLAALVVGAGCNSTRSVTPPAVFDPADLVAELKKSAAGWNAGDLDAFMSIYAEDATFAQPDRFIRGKAAIRALYAQAFAPGVA